MSIFRDFFNVKQSPIFTGSRFGFGSGGGAAAEGGLTPKTYVIELFGGGGGAGSSGGSGGSGGYSKVSITLNAGQTYYVTAGVKGYNGQNSGARVRSSGGNGLRQSNTDQGGSGGGFSALWTNSGYTGNPILLVGGGGGSDWQDLGGDGGGVNQDGGKGYDQINGAAEHTPLAVPSGATLSAGGSYNWVYSASNCNGEAGVYLRGGDSTCSDTYAGGAGGGGYYGGGAGTGNTGNGGTPGSGGSGYADTSNYTISITTNTSPGQRNGSFQPGSSGTYHQSNHPGGSYGGGGSPGNHGQHGRVRIYAADGTTLISDVTGPATNTAVTLT